MYSFAPGTGRPSGASTRPWKATLPGVSSRVGSGGRTVDSPLVRDGECWLAAGFFEGSSARETKAADTPQAIRPAATSVTDTNVSFWSNMILSTSRVNSLAPAETTPTVIV